MRKEKIIVANTGDDSLSVIDIKNNYKSKKIPFSSFLTSNRKKNMKFYLNSFAIGPYDIHVNHKMDKIYTTNSYNNSVFKINLSQKIVEDLVAVGSCPTCIKFYNDLILISNSDSNSISIIDEYCFELIESISVGENPNDIEIDKETGRIFVANSYGLSVEVIDLQKDNIERITLKSNPVKIQFDRNFLYILSNKNNGSYNWSNISIIDPNNYRLIKSLDLKGIFNYMIKLKDKDLIFLTNIESGFLYKLDIKKNKVVDKIFIGGMPNRILWNGNSILYITNINKNLLTVINYKKGKVLKNVKVGTEPNGMIFL